MTETIEPVIVIGAGAAGLAAADALARHGIKASVFEREQRIAEPWHQRHERLALNTHRDMSFLPGMPYPRGVPAFPPKAAVIAYLEQFAMPNSTATTLPSIPPRACAMRATSSLPPATTRCRGCRTGQVRRHSAAG